MGNAGSSQKSLDDRYQGLASLGDVEIDRKCVNDGEELGEGHFGTVHKGVLKEKGEEKMIAIKILKTTSTMSKDQFLDEARIMRKLNHPNIVRMYGVCREKDPILIITEYMNEGSLDKYIKRETEEVLTNKNLENIAGQITLGMSYLEQQRFVHRDLRTANVLLSKTPEERIEAKVADFGLARLVDLIGVHQFGSGSAVPMVWTAPEARYQGIFTSKSDVYSFGCLLYEMITYGDEPQEDMNALVIHRPMPSNCSKKYFDTMKKCLASKPEDRPTFKKLEKVF